MLISNDSQDSTSTTEGGEPLQVYAPLNPKGMAAAQDDEECDRDVIPFFNENEDEDEDEDSLTDIDAYRQQAAQAEAIKKTIYPSRLANSVWCRSLMRTPRELLSPYEKELYRAKRKLNVHKEKLSRARNGGELLTTSRRVVESLILHEHWSRLVLVDNIRRGRPYRPPAKPPAIYILRGKGAIVDGPPINP
jgi:hypothetical protein